MGYQAGTAINTGGFNAFVGDQAGTTLTTASNNTGMGYAAVEKSNAANNTGFGSSANRNNTGVNNTAIGAEALKGASGSTSTNNTAIGQHAGQVIDDGNYNIFVGSDAGQNLTTGSGNVIIGSVNAGSATGSRQLLIAGNDGSTTTTWISGSSAGVETLNAANVTQQALTSSSNAVAWDASAKPNAVHITTENTTFSAPSNAIEGAFICVEINYNGSHSIAWNTVFEFAASTAPTFTSADGKTDIMVFRYSGAVWQEVGRTLNLSEA